MLCTAWRVFVLRRNFVLHFVLHSYGNVWFASGLEYPIPGINIQAETLIK
jgi:hypothetical protein